MSDRILIETHAVECPDGIGHYLSEGAEVTVWENTIDPEYVIKVQKLNLAGFAAQIAPFVNQARWTRKKLLYRALKDNQRAIRVADTFFFEGFLWQERLGIPLARMIARHPDIWERIGGDFIHRTSILQAIAKSRMNEALDKKPREIVKTFGDELAELRGVDAHFFNFAIRCLDPKQIGKVEVRDVYLIDW